MENDGQPIIDPDTVRSIGVSLGTKTSSSLFNVIKVKELEGNPLIDTYALKSLLQCLRLAQVRRIFFLIFILHILVCTCVKRWTCC